MATPAAAFQISCCPPHKRLNYLRPVHKIFILQTYVPRRPFLIFPFHRQARVSIINFERNFQESVWSSFVTSVFCTSPILVSRPEHQKHQETPREEKVQTKVLS